MFSICQQVEYLVDMGADLAALDRNKERKDSHCERLVCIAGSSYNIQGPHSSGMIHFPVVYDIVNCGKTN